MRKIMRQLGLKSKVRPRRKYNSHQGTPATIADNILDRQFTADAPNRKWVSDVARSIDGLDARLRALEKTQTDCRVELARGYATRAEMERVSERLENHATRLAVLEERDLAA